MPELDWTVGAHEVEAAAAILADMAANVAAGYMEAARAGDGLVFRLTTLGQAFDEADDDEPLPDCARPGCGHPEAAHARRDGQPVAAGACDYCGGCAAYALPQAEDGEARVALAPAGRARAGARASGWLPVAAPQTEAAR